MTDLLILLGVSLAVSAVGWIYFIYFFSLGYGYGVAALAIAMLIMHSEAATPPTIGLLSARTRTQSRCLSQDTIRPTTTAKETAQRDAHRVDFLRCAIRVAG